MEGKLTHISAILLVIVAIVFAYYGVPHRVEFFTEEGWRQEIQRLGGKEAFNKLVEHNASLGVTEQHEQAHFFGGALYEVEHLEGLPVCDSQFSYGCYHEFLGRAVADKGTDYIVQIGESCAEAMEGSPFACLHGLGHGIVASLGYELEDLKASLATCDKLKNGTTLGGCVGGVFMEYNLRSMIGGIRVSDNLLAPCDTIEPRFADACAHSMPQWWLNFTLHSMTSVEKFKHVGALCLALPHGARSCFEGAGIMVALEAKFSPATTIEYCNVMAEGFNRLSCLSFAANTFFTNAERDLAPLVCEGLREEETKYCQAHALNQANILNRLAPPQ